jgi:hypothetical protein
MAPKMKTHTKHDERVSVRIPKDVAAWLKKASRLRRVPASIIIREAILDKFDQRHSDRKREA